MEHIFFEWDYHRSVKRATQQIKNSDNLQHISFVISLTMSNNKIIQMMHLHYFDLVLSIPGLLDQSKGKSTFRFFMKIWIETCLHACLKVSLADYCPFYKQMGCPTVIVISNLIFFLMEFPVFNSHCNHTGESKVFFFCFPLHFTWDLCGQSLPGIARKR